MGVKQGRVLAVLWLALGLALPAWTQPESARVVVYPQSQQDWRTQYPVKLLERALQLSGGTYVIRASAQPSPKARNFSNLANRRGVDVVWSMTSREREQLHRAIRIPLYKGLMGNRLALIRTSEPYLLGEVHNLTQLSTYSLGQLYAWTDTQILTHNGLTVVPGSSYAALFRMLAAGRFDVFPRSVTEVGDELMRFGELGLALDQYLLIQYPAAQYFFVNRQDEELAQAIERGLESMLASGEFDTLFRAHFGELVASLRLEERRVMKLTNPLLPDDTPLCRKALWWWDMCSAGAVVANEQ
jgi:hypothetical protein